MSKTFGIAFGSALVAIIVVIAIAYTATKGNHLAPTGAIGKVRTLGPSDDLTYMVIDFNVKNDSDRDMIVHSIEGEVDTADGGMLTASPVAASDVDAAFKSYPVLGEQYNPVLKDRDKIPAHSMLDRMVGLRIDAPVAKVDARRQVILRVTDITGPVLELKK